MSRQDVTYNFETYNEINIDGCTHFSNVSSHKATTEELYNTFHCSYVSIN